jgi:hypothetical protein
MVDLVDFQKKLLNHVMAYHFKVGLSEQMRHVLFAAREKVVNADDLANVTSTFLHAEDQFA